MSWFQLDPESLASRVRGPADLPSLGASVMRGIIGFTIVSIAGFIPWAIFGRWFYRQIGEAGLYAVCAIVFIGLSGLLMHRLIIGSGSLGRFYKLFSLSFVVYSVAWIVGWMLLRGHPGSLVGLFAGTALMGWMLAVAFDAQKSIVQVIAALFILNALGYFVGGWVEAAAISSRQISVFGTALEKRTQAMIAKLLWGVCYGIGFGAGLGLAFHICQARARALVTANP